MFFIELDLTQVYSYQHVKLKNDIVLKGTKAQKSQYVKCSQNKIIIDDNNNA